MLCSGDKPTNKVREAWLIYTLLGGIESDKEEDIENLTNDSDAEFVDRSVVENKDSNMQVNE